MATIWVDLKSLLPYLNDFNFLLILLKAFTSGIRPVLFRIQPSYLCINTEAHTPPMERKRLKFAFLTIGGGSTRGKMISSWNSCANLVASWTGGGFGKLETQRLRLNGKPGCSLGTRLETQK